MLPDSIATPRAGGRQLLMGLCGSIASVRGLDLVRDLAGIGVETHVTMTDAASEFVTVTSLRSFGAKTVSGSLFGDPDNPFPHLDVGGSNDAFLVLAATANTIAKLAFGMADNLLTTQALAFSGPRFVAPAMNTLMWDNTLVQRNVGVLREHGYDIIGPDSGLLACRTTGKGKLAPVHQIAAQVIRSFFKKPLAGRKALVTLGSTREHFDPVRFIGNPSSGLMGACIAHVLWFLGADVTVVEGHSSVFLCDAFNRIKAGSAAEMYEAVMDAAPHQDVLAFVAAVADYTSAKAPHKLKKSAERLTIACEPTRDIAASFGRTKRAGQVSIGFAAETQDLLEAMRGKLERKNFDLIVGNNLAAEGSGFAVATNQAILLDRSGHVEHLPLLSKMELAHRVADWLTGVLA